MPQYLQSKTSRIEKLRRVAARAAAFNPEDADVAITAGGEHPTDLGHAIIAARAAAGIRSMLATY